MFVFPDMKIVFGFIGVFLSFLLGECVVSLPQLKCLNMIPLKAELELHTLSNIYLQGCICHQFIDRFKESSQYMLVAFVSFVT